MLCIYKSCIKVDHRHCTDIRYLQRSIDITNNLKVQGEMDVFIQIKIVEGNFKSPAKYKSYVIEGLLTWVRVARKIL